jgi:predicted 3-demethylubiquinone-9 3-methyltransferase (glyoxalase superfamily)
MPIVQRIAPCLWFDHQAEEAAAFYTSSFRNSRIVLVARLGEAGLRWVVLGRPPRGSIA